MADDSRVKCQEIIAMSDAGNTVARVVENRIETCACRRWAVILAGGYGSYRVIQFCEKPSPAFAERLMARGCLWNSFVMVGHVKAFLNLFDRTLPSLTNAFESIRQSFSTESERWLLTGLYPSIREINFSSEVLSAHSHDSVYPCDLSVLRVLAENPRQDLF
jgi:hypothetical protein